MRRTIHVMMDLAGHGRSLWFRLAVVCLLVLALVFPANLGSRDDCADECDSAECSCACHLTSPVCALDAAPESRGVSAAVMSLHRLPPDLLLVADIFRPPTA